MVAADPEQVVAGYLQPWHGAISCPGKAQEEVLHRFLATYVQAGCGTQHGAAHVETLADYRRAFRITTYETYRPPIRRVMAGDTRLQAIARLIV